MTDNSVINHVAVAALDVVPIDGGRQGAGAGVQPVSGLVAGNLCIFEVNGLVPDEGRGLVACVDERVSGLGGRVDCNVRPDGAELRQPL